MLEAGRGVDLLSPALKGACMLQLGCKASESAWNGQRSWQSCRHSEPVISRASKVLLEQASASGGDIWLLSTAGSPYSRYGRPHLGLSKHCGQRGHPCAGAGPGTAAPHQAGGSWLQEIGSPLRNGSLGGWVLQ